MPTPIVVSYSELDAARHGHPAQRSFTELDVAWAAGFLEGDGTFYRRPGHGSIFVQVHQVNLEPLHRLVEVFGGRISHLRPNPKTPTHSPKGVWTVNGDRAVALMLLVWPYMSAKRRAQIERALPEGVDRNNAEAHRRFL